MNFYFSCLDISNKEIEWFHWIESADCFLETEFFMLLNQLSKKAVIMLVVKTEHDNQGANSSTITLWRKREYILNTHNPLGYILVLSGLWLKSKGKENSSVMFKANYLDHFTSVINTVNKKSIYWRLREVKMGSEKRWFCIPRMITSLVMEMRTIIDRFSSLLGKYKYIACICLICVFFSSNACNTKYFWVYLII